MLIRAEEEKDRTAVHEINVAAFERPTEADLVDALREQAEPVVSLVAEEDGEIVGHIMFTAVSLGGHPDVEAMNLAPLAVAPGHQRRGIGSELVRAGLGRCGELGFGAVFVVGHPEYYPRFGFSRSSQFGIDCEYEAPDEAFMAMELEAGYLHGRSGTLFLHAAFRDAMRDAPAQSH